MKPALTRAVFLGVLSVALGVGAAHAQFEISPWPARMAPAPVKWVDVTGRSWEADQLRGKALVINFWATWCPACRQSRPYLLEWSRAHKGVNVIGITDEDEELVNEFIKKEGDSYTTALDSSQKLLRAMQITSFPSFLLIDRQGRVQMIKEGSGRPLTEILSVAEILE